MFEPYSGRAAALILHSYDVFFFCIQLKFRSQITAVFMFIHDRLSNIQPNDWAHFICLAWEHDTFLFFVFKFARFKTQSLLYIWYACFRLRCFRILSFRLLRGKYRQNLFHLTKWGRMQRVFLRTQNFLLHFTLNSDSSLLSIAKVLCVRYRFG